MRKPRIDRNAIEPNGGRPYEPRMHRACMIPDIWVGHITYRTERYRSMHCRSLWDRILDADFRVMITSLKGTFGLSAQMKKG